MSADEDGEALLALTCPAPAGEGGAVTLGHGSGGRLAQRLLEETILPLLGMEGRVEDQAILPVLQGAPAFTTDSYVITPRRFPGGDLGSLAVHGTVNDLAVGGARPRWLSLGMILEEGLPLAELEDVLRSVAAAAAACEVRVVTGDTKVVGRGSADGIFLNTAGLGEVPAGRELGAAALRPGDAVLVSGTLADHGVAVLGAREGLGLPDTVRSDSAPLHGLTEALLEADVGVRCMRDPTRGGVAAVAYEWSRRAGVALELEEAALPMTPAVRGACELLGLDPLHVANEGKLVVAVPAEAADRALEVLRSHSLGAAAARIGVVAEGAGVRVRTPIGGTRSLVLPLEDPLPRIC